ncbi:alpha/beta fold hydrolase [Calidifontibacter sp. DB0510]|uniref:Alpha/beta fold hydrolase n=1 Tax=Metallococcus carri TaxID=1656884 RepID=A0A967EB59_9MICO|nr:alpha/beta fold hydrolase [Metallococcus carri]NHN56970.1 alpha/beta fold hydrolase [Metallococcus carri]NOP37715.1 alpha/beta fold hydrolase [Calidifontibacter sp. DB2511S]
MTSIAPGVEVVQAAAPSGTIALLHKPAAPEQRTVVYLHGNGSDLATVRPLVEIIGRRGLGFAAIEYPGYGVLRAEKPSERAIYARVADSLAHLRDAGCEPQDTVLVGESLGSAVATEMAHRGLGGRLVLLSAFTSMPAMFKNTFRPYPARLVPDKFDTLAKASAIGIPTLLIHGETDALVPSAMSEQLEHRFPNARREIIHGRDHGNLWAPPSRTAELVREFASAR